MGRAGERGRSSFNWLAAGPAAVGSAVVLIRKRSGDSGQSEVVPKWDASPFALATGFAERRKTTQAEHGGSNVEKRSGS